VKEELETCSGRPYLERSGSAVAEQAYQTGLLKRMDFCFAKHQSIG